MLYLWLHENTAPEVLGSLQLALLICCVLAWVQSDHLSTTLLLLIGCSTLAHGNSVSALLQLFHLLRVPDVYAAFIVC